MSRTVHCDGCGCTLEPFQPAVHVINTLVERGDQTLFGSERELCGTCLKLFVGKLDPRDWPRCIPEAPDLAEKRRKGARRDG